MIEEDGDDVGFTTYDYGCNFCPTEFVDGKPMRQRIEPRGRWMCCVKCGGSYGDVPALWGYEVLSVDGYWVPEQKSGEPPDADMFCIRNLHRIAAAKEDQRG